MTEISIIRKLIFLENTLCIFRNYSLMSPKFKCIAITCAVTKLFMHTIALIISIHTFLTSAMDLDAVYVAAFGYFGNINSILAIFLGFKNNKYFKGLCWRMDVLHNEFKHDQDFQKSLNCVNLFGIILTTIFVCVYTTMLTYLFMDITYYYQSNPIQYSVIFTTLIMVCSEYRYFYGFLSIIMLTGIIGQYLKFLKLRIANFGGMSSHSTFEAQLQNNLEKWETIVRHLSQCSDQLKQCFCAQIVFSVVAVTVYFILIIYREVTILAQKNTQSIGRWNTYALFGNYLVVIIPLLYTGQKARDEADAVTRSLARLYNTLVTGEHPEKLTKSVKNLHRQMVVAPIRIKILSTVFIQMPLLPEFLTIILTYAIIFLQFNHVV